MSKPADTAEGGCCTPRMAVGVKTAVARPVQAASAAPFRRGEDLCAVVLVPADTFLYGCNRREGQPSDGEGPAHRVQLDAFHIDITAVSIARFTRFVAETDYVTDAEREGWSFVFAGLLPDDFAETRGLASAPWWRQVFGACWRHPDGPQSSIDGRNDLPVVHVSHADALAFCAWAGKRLPSEVEWERAARGGLEQKRFPWGDDEMPGGVAHCNVWQGRFPDRNDLTDGYYGLAPVDAFPPNNFGLYNMAGNAWEWCADWSTSHRFTDFAISPTTIVAPFGPADGDMRVIRGGSYLCHPSYCWRYRSAARSASTPDSSTGHIGFRCVMDGVER